MFRKDWTNYMVKTITETKLTLDLGKVFQNSLFQIYKCIFQIDYLYLQYITKVFASKYNSSNDKRLDFILLVLNYN